MERRMGFALNWAEQKLHLANVATAHLDALVLLEDTTKIDRARLLSEPNKSLSESMLRQYKRKVLARAKHLPLAYIRSKSEFYGREFYINQSVLEPRPESETLIDEFLAITKREPAIKTVIDIGTGSGALIISAKLEKPDIAAFGVDVDPKCLVVARRNAAKYNQEIDFYGGHLTTQIPKTVWNNGKTLVLANLPYVPDDWQINQAATHEPAIAIFGGPDGLKLYRQLFKQLAQLEKPPDWVLTEAMPPQHKNLSQIAANAGYLTLTTNDFIQVYKHKNKI